MPDSEEELVHTRYGDLFALTGLAVMSAVLVTAGAARRRAVPALGSLSG